MSKYLNILNFLGKILLIGITAKANALTYQIRPNSDIVGEVQIIEVGDNQSFGNIAEQFDVGIYDLIEANPGIDPWSPQVGTQLIVPTRFILPPSPRKGLIINLAEMRIYYFHADKIHLSTYPIGIGRKGWNTPLAATKVISKKEKPTWIPPISIILEHKKNGDILPTSVPPGPDNPLGNYAIRLALPGYLIHGTNRIGGIGVRSSSGCIRLFPKDIEELFKLVAVGTPVYITHTPYKIGKYNNKLYVEIHQPLTDDYYNHKKSHHEFMEKLFKLSKTYPLKWDLANSALEKSYGYPVPIE